MSAADDGVKPGPGRGRGMRKSIRTNGGSDVFVHGVSRDEIDEIARGLNMRVIDARADGGIKLRPDRDLPEDMQVFAAHSGNRYTEGRRIYAICHHGHLAFFAAVFNRNPKATIKTATATYTSRDNLLFTWSQTPMWNSSQGCQCDYADIVLAEQGRIHDGYKREVATA